TRKVFPMEERHFLRSRQLVCVGLLAFAILLGPAGVLAHAQGLASSGRAGGLVRDSGQGTLAASAAGHSIVDKARDRAASGSITRAGPGCPAFCAAISAGAASYICDKFPNSLHGNREIPQASAPGVADRPEKVSDRTSGMHACGKSDGRIVPGKPPNKGMRK